MIRLALIRLLLLISVFMILLCGCRAFQISSHLDCTTRRSQMQVRAMSSSPRPNKGMDRVAVVQTGFGCCHGRNPTKAAVRACRNAIDSNSIKIRTIIPGGYDAMKIHVQVGIPEGIGVVDEQAIQAEFPYGNLLPLDVQPGGMLASNGIWQPGVAEPKDDMTVAVVCVTIGFDLQQ